MNNQNGHGSGAAVATAADAPAAPRQPLPDKPGWERMDGRLSGGYYRRPGVSTHAPAAV